MPPNPLPEGYRLWFWPHYRLETPTVCIELSPLIGNVLAFLVVNRGKRVFCSEIFAAIYLGRGNRRPSTGSSIVPMHMMSLKKRLKEVGIAMDLMSRKSLAGYVFRGFETCEPVTWRKVNPTRKEAKTRRLDIQTSPKQLSPHPRIGGVVYCSDIPWAVPLRVENHLRYREEGLMAAEEEKFRKQQEISDDR